MELFETEERNGLCGPRCQSNHFNHIVVCVASRRQEVLSLAIDSVYNLINSCIVFVANLVQLLYTQIDVSQSLVQFNDCLHCVIPFMNQSLSQRASLFHQLSSLFALIVVDHNEVEVVAILAMRDSYHYFDELSTERAKVVFCCPFGQTRNAEAVSAGVGQTDIGYPFPNRSDTPSHPYRQSLTVPFWSDICSLFTKLHKKL